MKTRKFQATTNLFNLSEELPIRDYFQFTERIINPFMRNNRGEKRARNFEEVVEIKLKNGDYLILYTHGKEISVTVETPNREWVLKLENGTLSKNEKFVNTAQLQAVYDAYITECIIELFRFKEVDYLDMIKLFGVKDILKDEYLDFFQNE